MISKLWWVVALGICLVGPVASAGCAAPMDPALKAAADHVVITGTDAIPGRTYQVLGMVRVDGGDIYNDCSSPEKLKVKAIQQFGTNVDAIIAFKTTNSNCEPTALGNMCFDACEGTAVQFSDSAASR